MGMNTDSTDDREESLRKAVCLVHYVVPDRERSIECIVCCTAGEAGAFLTHACQAFGSFIDDEAELAAPLHASGFVVLAEHRAAEVLDRLRQKAHGLAHEPRPGGPRRAAGEDEEERFSFEGTVGVGGIERERPHAIDEVLQVRRNREIPDGSGDDDAVRLLYEVLQGAKILFLRACGIVEFQTEVIDLQGGKFHGVDCQIVDCRPGTFGKGGSEQDTIARIVRAGDEDEQAIHDPMVQEREWI